MKPEKIEGVLLEEYPDEDISSAEISTLLDQIKQVAKRTSRR